MVRRNPPKKRGWLGERMSLMKEFISMAFLVELIANSVVKFGLSLLMALSPLLTLSVELY